MKTMGNYAALTLSNADSRSNSDSIISHVHGIHNIRNWAETMVLTTLYLAVWPYMKQYVGFICRVH